jgi:hypothetical protein
MSGHTPGPWTWTPNGSDVVIVDATGGLVAVVRPDDRHSDRSFADIRLIAAAPELLEVLRDVLAVYDGPQPVTVGLLERMRAAVARAGGG